MPRQEGTQPEEVAREAQRQSAYERFSLLREANMEAYLATSEEQFITAVGADIADQRTYLLHQILYTQPRLEAFGVSLPRNSSASIRGDLKLLPRRRLITIFSGQEVYLEQIFGDKANWDKIVSVPFSEGVTGAELLSRLREHEAHHEGMNRVILGHFGIPLPEAVIRPFGK